MPLCACRHIEQSASGFTVWFHLWLKMALNLNRVFQMQNNKGVNCFHFWVYPQRLVYIGRRFGTLCRVHLQRLETSANIHQTLRIHPKVETVNTEHSESLKSRIKVFFRPYTVFRISAALKFRSGNFNLITPISLSALYGGSEFCYLWLLFFCFQLQELTTTKTWWTKLGTIYIAPYCHFQLEMDKKWSSVSMQIQDS
jgi:hypothetical protein